MTLGPLNLQKTAEAIRKYDECRARFDACPIGELNDDIYKELILCEDQVSECFANDTADRNPRDTALLIGPGPWLRELCAKYGVS